MIAIGLAIQVMALLLVLILHKCKHRALPFAILSFAASIIMTLGYGRYLLSGIASTYTISFIPLIPPSVVILDPLAAFFGLIFAFGFPLGLLYGSYYIKAHPAEGITAHLFWLGLMIISMHLVLMFRNSLLFMIAWELMSLSSFFAILYERDNKETIANALYYFVMMHIGAAVLLAGFGMLYLRSGSFNFANSYIYNPAKWLLLIGFAFKAGFFPFYSWLPKAHPVAPAHLSCLMSGLMIKTGIFGIIFVLLQSLWQPYELYILLGIALLTAFNGVIHAMVETNIKRSLA
ncbi:MAG: proton-conducting transporter membrane subunit, partial [Candidatus Cloacimonetes bacterium]|nr:proton-conducting transporter membrane subunit [Candidatus Cloacimonadota bacterium]